MIDPLAKMKTYDQWILWRLDGEIKHPIDYRTLRVGNPHDPEIWMPYAAAKALATGEYHLAFVFTAHDPFFFLDLDDCLTSTGWSETALAVLREFSGAAVEISPSGTGLHIYGCGTCPPHGCKNTALGIELYTEGRFAAVTERDLLGDTSTDHSAALASLVTRYLPQVAAVTPESWSDKPVPEWAGPTDDTDLLARAMRSRSAKGVFGGCTFRDLWAADAEALGRAYPTTDARDYDASSADAALAQHLAFWTGKDCERISRLMRQSALVRPKWEREDYLPRTIIRAVSIQRDVYAKREPQPPDPKPAPRPETGPLLVSGFQYLTGEAQVEYFRGCRYVTSTHRIFTPRGAMLKPDQFNAAYGGYVFQLDETGDKTTRKAWEAFTESQVVRFPKVDGMCFKPTEPPGAILEQEGLSLVNIYVDVPVERTSGDAGPFLGLLEKLLPDRRDRDIVLAYMAACVQHKGVKFQWAPLLQGTEGNGKTFLTRCVAHAVAKRYTHMPKAAELANKFNGWIMNKVFIGVEDIHVADNKSELIEALKPMITGQDLEIESKNVDQFTADICANFMFNSNHKDAIRKTLTDRRFAVFYTAQQSPEDMAKAGMNGNYFPDLYNWARAGGYAIVAEYLHTYAIPDALNPATLCHRAPETGSTLEAVSASLGGIEQAVSEAIDEGRMGFAEGWVSSMALEKLLREMRAARTIPPNKRRDLLRQLGYDWHPGLVNGRTNNPVLIDGGKPRLFIKQGHLACNLRSPVEIVAAYEKAQTQGPGGQLGERGIVG